MIEEAEKFDFSDDSLCINQVLKSIVNFLNCNLHVILLVHGGHYNSICPSPDKLDVVIVSINDESGTCKYVRN